MLHLLFAVLLTINGYTHYPNPIQPCSKKTNCISSLGKKDSSKWSPLKHYKSAQQSIELLKKIVLKMANTTLLKETPNYLKFEFTTQIGNFADIVEFFVDPQHKIIHYKSESQKGYADFGTNKRRIKKIKKMWNSHLTP